MMGHSVRFVVLVSLCGAGAAYAQSSPPNPGRIHDASWVNADLGDDVSARDGGLHILAQNVRDNAPSTHAVGRHRDGIGAAGAQASAPAVKAETGFDPVQYRSEQIIILFDQPVMKANVDVTYFYRNEAEHAGTAYHERGGWRAYRDNVQIGQGLFLPEPTGGAHQIVIVARAPFDRLEMFATPYVSESGAEIEPGLITTDSSDFLIKHIAYQPERERLASAGH